MKAKLKLILISFCFVFFVLFFCEYVIYYVIISLCYWPPLSATPVLPATRAMVLADTHLLGRIKGHWLDKLRREWQMLRSFQTSMHLLSPDLVIILGDVFDEGLWATSEDFDVYVKRFNHLFAFNPNNTKLIVVVGNHDIGFHYWTDGFLRRRFQLAFNTSDVDLIDVSNGIHFVAINSIALEGDNCFLCKEAVLKIKKIGHKLRTKSISPIILMHFPLYRESEQICTETDSASDKEKAIKYRERMDCLSKESTDFVLKELRPRLVLTGHSHHSCIVAHKGIPEWTVASFNWRNKINPSFLLTTITSNDYSIEKCFLPNETTVFNIYFICFLLLFCFNLYKIFVIQYTKQKVI